jgi:hypothetical protein
MHTRVQKLKKVQHQIAQILKELPKEEKYSSLKTKGNAIVKQLISWDEDMVQRKSKAYDDVENFPNKFTAEYIFLMNQNDSSLPKLNQASKNRLVELDKQWQALRSISEELLNTVIPTYNTLLWEHGIGALKTK